MKLQLRSGVATVATAGTRVQLSTTTKWAIGLSLEAPAANAGVVYLGDVTVASSNGRVIAAGARIGAKDLLGEVQLKEGDDAPRTNLSTVYIDAANNGDKITFSYWEIVQ